MGSLHCNFRPIGFSTNKVGLGFKVGFGVLKLVRESASWQGCNVVGLTYVAREPESRLHPSQFGLLGQIGGFSLGFSPRELCVRPPRLVISIMAFVGR